jgi:hypothetical protein
MTLPNSTVQRESEKFIETSDGKVAVRAVIAEGTLEISEDILPDISYYQTNHIDENTTTASVTYIGMEKDDGAWCVKRINETVGAKPVFTYATITNNSTVETYAAAWAAISSLTYGTYSQAF